MVEVCKDGLKNEGEHVIEAAPLMVGAGAVESAGGKEKSLGVFLEILRDRRRFREVDQRSRDKVDKVEFRCILTPQR